MTLNKHHSVRPTLKEKQEDKARRLQAQRAFRESRERYSRKNKQGGTMPQHIARAAADELGTDVITPKIAQQLYVTMTSIIHAELKKNRKCKLPGIGVIKLNFRPAQKGGQTKIVFGKEIETKAKKASNKLKILPLKALKEYAATLPAVAPKGKNRGRAA